MVDILMDIHVMVNIIDSCQKVYPLTSVTWAKLYIVQVIEVKCFFKLSADQWLVLIVCSLRSILKRPYNKQLINLVCSVILKKSQALALMYH